jgi:hypothetical protein
MEIQTPLLVIYCFIQLKSFFRNGPIIIFFLMFFGSMLAGNLAKAQDVRGPQAQVNAPINTHRERPENFGFMDEMSLCFFPKKTLKKAMENTNIPAIIHILKCISPAILIEAYNKDETFLNKLLFMSEDSVLLRNELMSWIDQKFDAEFIKANSKKSDLIFESLVLGKKPLHLDTNSYFIFSRIIYMILENYPTDDFFTFSFLDFLTEKLIPRFVSPEQFQVLLHRQYHRLKPKKNFKWNFENLFLDFLNPNPAKNPEFNVLHGISGQSQKKYLTDLKSLLDIFYFSHWLAPEIKDSILEEILKKHGP